MPYERSHGRQCIVTGCFYTERDRYRLLNANCPHEQLRKDCGCETVFKFHKFPINSVVRKKWVENVNRKDVSEDNCRKRSFVVCSTHFSDGQPTKENPYPTLYMQEPCPNPKFIAGLNYSFPPAPPVTKPQKESSILRDVQRVVSKLCNIICESEEEAEEPSDQNTKQQNENIILDSEDSLSARRNRRTIKKTYKARTFEKEKLFNRIRFGRPENRSLLLSLLRKTIDLPKVKECSVTLPKLNVESTIRLSEWKDYSLHCKNPLFEFDIKIDSDGSYTEELSPLSQVVVKTETDYDSLPELEFEIDNDYTVREQNESVSISPKRQSTVEDSSFSPPPAKLRKVGSPGNHQKNSVTFSTSPKIKVIPFVKKQPSGKFDSAAEKSKFVERSKMGTSRVPTPALKISNESSKETHAQTPLKPRMLPMGPKILAAKKTGKAPVKIQPPKVSSEKLRIENMKKMRSPQIRIGPAKVLADNVKIRQAEAIVSTPSTVQPFKVSNSKYKGSVKHTANVKVIRTYSNEKELKANNKMNTQKSNVLTKPLETLSEDENLSAVEEDLSRSSTSKTLPKSDVRLKQPPSISKIWTELHTHYDYTEEEEVPFSELPEIDDLTSYVVYEGEESDLSEEEEEAESELGVAESLTDEKCFAFTGLSLLVFKGLCGILKECAPKSDPSINLAVSDQLLLALMKLKVGLINADLSQKFNTQAVTCGKIFSRWLNVMYKTLNHMVVWKSRNSVIQEMPELFDEHSSLAACLIDVGEISVQAPKNQTKADQPIEKPAAAIKKFLYAVAPDGFVIFVSQLYEGNVTEAHMFADCGILNHFESGDIVFVNKEFTDGLDLPSDIVFDVLPHTKVENGNEQLASVSKKAVDRLKIFRILRGVITVPFTSAPHIMQTCAALSNLGLIR